MVKLSAVSATLPSDSRRLRALVYEGPSAPPAHSQPGGAPRRVIRIDADFASAGAWSGVDHLVELAYLDARSRALTDVIERHNYELNRVLPEYRHELSLKYATLTDSTVGSERTRNFPLDRAYRLVNGLVEFTLAWKRRSGSGESWVIAIERFDQAQHLATRYFAELARRGAGAEGFTVLVDTALDAEALARRAPRTRAVESSLSADMSGGPPAQPCDLTEEALTRIEYKLGANDIHDWERYYPALLRHYRKLGDETRCADIAIRALCISNHYGYYHEAASFADTVLGRLDEIVGDDQIKRWNYLGNLFTGLVTTGREEDALQMLIERADKVITLREYRAKMHYLLSMIHLRYLKVPNMEAAERHILMAIEAIEAAREEADPADYVFLRVFIGNGLAFLRVRQGRHAEAMTLCRNGYALLTDALGEEKHQLHRSVLQYNIAQVYSMMGQDDDAVEYYRKAMQMDPHYSEYYNEVGNILQRSGKFEEAEAMYDLAIEYSAPYPEVYFNKAICRMSTGRIEESLECLARSLELNPEQPELYILRAELLESLDRIAETLADYDAAIALSPNAITARVNRAVLHFNANRFDLALIDMDYVVGIDSGEPSHYLNRAEIHKAMAQRELYQRDLAAAEACEATV
jgi:tetratricopeptide (TPR) repeat protein